MPDVSTTAAASAAPETDDIGSAVRAAFDKHAEPAPAAEAGTKAVEAAPSTPAAPADSPAAAAMEAGKTIDAPAPAADTNLAPEVKARLDRIPVGWKGGAAAWHSIPPEAKQYIVERNGQIDQTLQKQAPAVEFANAVSQVFRPHEGFLRAQGANPIQAAQFLMDGYVQLMTGTPAQRQEVLRNLAQSAGVQLESIQGEAPQVDPELAALRQRVQQFEKYVNNQQQSAQTAEQQTLNAQIEEFRRSPGHEHFDVVMKPMAALLMSGAAQTMQEAYETACWAHPEVRPSLMAQREAQAAEKRKEEAEKAQRAAVSLKGAPTSVTAASLGDMDLRKSLETQFAAAGGRV